MKENKWGVLDRDNGREVIASVYDEVVMPLGHTYKSSIRVRKGQYWALFDFKGKQLTQFDYDSIGNYDCGLSITKKKGFYGVISRSSGRVATPCAYDEVVVTACESPKRIRVRRGSLWGFVIEGQPDDIPCIYEEVFDFSSKSRLAVVKKEGKWGVINMQGETVLPFIYDAVYCDLRREGDMVRIILASQGDKTFYLNAKGECIKNCP